MFTWFLIACTCVQLSPSQDFHSQEEVHIPNQYSEFTEVFSKACVAGLPLPRPYDWTIYVLPGVTPLYCWIYPLSVPDQWAIQEALQQRYMCSSTFPASAGVFLVENKGRGAQALYELLGPQSNLSKISLLTTLGSFGSGTTTIFTLLDLHNDYNVVCIRDGNEWKTVFSTSSGHYEYLVMPYGLSSAPSVFQSLNNDMLRQMLGKFIIAYIDNILIWHSDSDCPTPNFTSTTSKCCPVCGRTNYTSKEKSARAPKSPSLTTQSA